MQIQSYKYRLSKFGVIHKISVAHQWRVQEYPRKVEQKTFELEKLNDSRLFLQKYGFHAIIFSVKTIFSVGLPCKRYTFMTSTSN